VAEVFSGCGDRLHEEDVLYFVVVDLIAFFVIKHVVPGRIVVAYFVLLELVVQRFRDLLLTQVLLVMFVNLLPVECVLPVVDSVECLEEVLLEFGLDFLDHSLSQCGRVLESGLDAVRLQEFVGLLVNLLPGCLLVEYGAHHLESVVFVDEPC